MSTKEIFSKRLLEIRTSKCISRQKVADDLKITRSSLEYYEKGKRFPDINIINSIAEYYSVSVDYLFGRTDVKKTDKDVWFVCEYTGLSEEAILQLNLHKELISKSRNNCPKPLYSLIYDYFISSDNLFKIAHIISSYVTSKIELTNNNKRNNDLYKKFHSYLGEFSDIDKIPQELIDNYTNQITQICENEPVLEKDCQFALFNAQESIKDFAIKFAEKYLEEGIVYKTSNEANNE